MTCSLEAAKPQAFRMAFAPSIVNPRYNRLWLIPLDGADKDVAPLPFDPIVAEFRELLIAIGENDLEVRALPPQDPGEYIKSVWVWGGHIHLDTDGATQHFELYVAGRDNGLCRRFHQTASRAGALIPNRIRAKASELIPTTAFAWWMAAVWEFSTIEPICDDPQLDDECKCGGSFVVWNDPIAASLSAIETAGLVGHDPAALTTLQGEWSVPMSKTEFARRIFEKASARPREADVIWDEFEKVQHGPNTWSFRLDTLSPERRKKLEGGKR